MNSDEIKLNIKNQIEKINQSFGSSNIFGLNELLLDDIASLERNHKKIKWYFNIYKI